MELGFLRAPLIAALVAMALVAGNTMAQSNTVPDELEQAAAEFTAAVLGDEFTERIHPRALGLYWDGGFGGYVVVVPDTGDVPKADDYLGFGIPVRIEKIDLTPQQLAAIEADVADLMKQKTKNKGYSFTAHFDARAGKYVVGGSAPAAEMAALSEDYPDRLVYNETEPPEEWSRNNDAAPHSGGAKIVYFIDVCTSGFTVKKVSNGVKKMVTAGHCGAVGDAFVGGTGNAWGKMKQKAPWPARDSAFLGDSTYKGWIYVGSGSTTIERVESAHNPAIDTTYCFSGALSNQSCQHQVTALNAQWCRSGGCGFGFVLATNDGSGGEGNSGAPFYKRNGDTNKIRGILLGGDDDNIVVEKWSAIRDALDVSIVTN